MWTDTDPTEWFIEESDDLGATWTQIDDVAGTFRTIDEGTPDTWLRLYGVDGVGTPITQPSNAVIIPP